MVILNMFRENLKEQIEYKGLIIKELAAKTGISKRTIDTYVDNRNVIPNAEIAVKLAKALDTTVEYLVTGNEPSQTDYSLENDFEVLRKYKKTILDIDSLSPEIHEFVLEIIHTAANISKKPTGKH